MLPNRFITATLCTSDYKPTAYGYAASRTWDQVWLRLQNWYGREGRQNKVRWFMFQLLPFHPEHGKQGFSLRNQPYSSQFHPQHFISQHLTHT